MLRPPTRPGMVRAGPAHGVVASGAVARAYEGRGATRIDKTWTLHVRVPGIPAIFKYTLGEAAQNTQF